MKENRWLRLAVKEAEKSTYHQKVGAVVFNKNEFISCGHNYPNRSIQNHHPKFRKYPQTVHAEVDAIINARKDLKGASIIVVRINNQGQLRLSKPCKYCMMYIKHVQLKKIYYTISAYPYIEMIKV